MHSLMGISALLYIEPVPIECGEGQSPQMILLPLRGQEQSKEHFLELVPIATLGLLGKFPFYSLVWDILVHSRGFWQQPLQTQPREHPDRDSVSKIGRAHV